MPPTPIIRLRGGSGSSGISASSEDAFIHNLLDKFTRRGRQFQLPTAAPVVELRRGGVHSSSTTTEQQNAAAARWYDAVAMIAPPPPPPSRVLLLPRQSQPTPTPSIIPGYYTTGGPEPGAVAGITLGAVGGFILLLWLIYTCINIGNPEVGESSVGTASVVTRKHTTSRGHRRHSHRASRGGGETVEIRRTTSRGPTVVEEVVGGIGVDRVIVEERRRSVSRGPPPPPRMVPRDDYHDDDEVVVIEEHSPPPPRRQRSRIRSVERRSSGYREVDPDRFAGGDMPTVEIRRSSSRRR
ncbi:hypothetical protein B0H63DRAFT_520125 [Podospora didyma]|uniref:Uncharacterized protein n=1 Tax=Podospora didyma TaxID=330526 RepID=A0AAE0U4N9_9PEZI|nr:hypothetical protein B0H63DRAFT_520125 [Podospora didyma]